MSLKTAKALFFSIIPMYGRETFVLSAFKGNATYGRDAVRQELKENESAFIGEGRGIGECI